VDQVKPPNWARIEYRNQKDPGLLMRLIKFLFSTAFLRLIVLARYSPRHQWPRIIDAYFGYRVLRSACGSTGGSLGLVGVNIGGRFSGEREALALDAVRSSIGKPPARSRACRHGGRSQSRDCFLLTEVIAVVETQKSDRSSSERLVRERTEEGSLATIHLRHALPSFSARVYWFRFPAFLHRQDLGGLVSRAGRQLGYASQEIERDALFADGQFSVRQIWARSYLTAAGKNSN
jgi:hypothetical protein